MREPVYGRDSKPPSPQSATTVARQGIQWKRCQTTAQKNTPAGPPEHTDHLEASKAAIKPLTPSTGREALRRRLRKAFGPLWAFNGFGDRTPGPTQRPPYRTAPRTVPYRFSPGTVRLGGQLLSRTQASKGASQGSESKGWAVMAGAGAVQALEEVSQRARGRVRAWRRRRAAQRS